MRESETSSLRTIDILPRPGVRTWDSAGRSHIRIKKPCQTEIEKKQVF